MVLENVILTVRLAVVICQACGVAHGRHGSIFSGFTIVDFGEGRIYPGDWREIKHWLGNVARQRLSFAVSQICNVPARHLAEGSFDSWL